MGMIETVRRAGVSSAVGVARRLGALARITCVHAAGGVCTNVQGCAGFFKDCTEDMGESDGFVHAMILGDLAEEAEVVGG